VAAASASAATAIHAGHVGQAGWQPRRSAGGIPRGRRAPSISAVAGLPSPLILPVRLTIIKAICHDHLFDSCQLRHRQDAELERDRNGPFDKMGLICLDIPLWLTVLAASTPAVRSGSDGFIGLYRRRRRRATGHRGGQGRAAWSVGRVRPRARWHVRLCNRASSPRSRRGRVPREPQCAVPGWPGGGAGARRARCPSRCRGRRPVSTATLGG
jgi:hypothetical protein